MSNGKMLTDEVVQQSRTLARNGRPTLQAAMVGLTGGWGVAVGALGWHVADQCPADCCHVLGPALIVQTRVVAGLCLATGVALLGAGQLRRCPAGRPRWKLWTNLAPVVVFLPAGLALLIVAADASAQLDRQAPAAVVRLLSQILLLVSGICLLLGSAHVQLLA